ncbi:hypothetical protein TNCT_545321 [Trichonephila clavata]|uniref:Uncharacterized protein n=1 Tax=Trichonephila clavata TaxID=2740835 RepID=A0A8X6J579_TRICU|nr:hypothetical protein TNCT_545321 [Trichonephila clavata]
MKIACPQLRCMQRIHHWSITIGSNPSVNREAGIFQNQRPKQVLIIKSFNEALDELRDSTAKCKFYSFVKNVQSDYFQNIKQDLTSEKAIVQIDFAENYTLISQYEIQSAHWSQTSHAFHVLYLDYRQTPFSGHSK